eukprot:1195839-Prorocentrum_minimum.AAC.4
MRAPAQHPLRFVQNVPRRGLGVVAGLAGLRQGPLRQFLPFEEAREYVCTLGLTSQKVRVERVGRAPTQHPLRSGQNVLRTGLGVVGGLAGLRQGSIVSCVWHATQAVAGVVFTDYRVLVVSHTAPRAA